MNSAPLNRIQPYFPLQHTLILHNDRLIDSGFEVISGDTLKGKMQVLFQGEILDGASVLYAGSVLSGDVRLGKAVVIEPGALVKGPTLIGDNTEIRQGAYIRGSCLIGSGCVVGHVTEMKNTIMLDHAKAGHFAYLGDSILGLNVNLGAGTKLANLKFSDIPITVRTKEASYPTNLRKLGAIAGDNVQTGCNSVTNPGTILGPGCFLYPNAVAKGGYYPPGSIIRKA